jgi:hypothetical protein
MAMQEVKYSFPDEEDKGAREVEVDAADDADDDSIEIEKVKGEKEIEVPGRLKAGEVEIEIEDDTPVADRGRKPSKPPEDVSDTELENYSEKVKARIKHFSKGYHDERRAKEESMREQEALTAYAKKLVEENNALKGKVDQSTTTLVEQAKKAVAGELAAAKRQYKDAYEMGDTDAIIAAQEAIATATIRADKVANYRPAPLQTKETAVQVPQQARQPVVEQDKRAASWAGENEWFGSDDEMTGYALGLDAKLKRDGVDPRSDTYYETINARMRQKFPEQFDDGIEDEPAVTKKSSQVVAPATRSTGPNKIRLTRSQVAIANKLGVPLEIYAKQAAALAREQK